MTNKLKVIHSNFLIGVLFLSIFFLISGCDKNKIIDKERTFLTPIDSIHFNYSSDSWKGINSNYSENRYGRKLMLDSNNNFWYFSIDSENQLHKFNFGTNKHSYSKKICNYKIEAYKLDTSLIYLLFDNKLVIKDYHLNTIDSFVYLAPTINKKHGIDFDLENSHSIFKVKNYLALLYYVVDTMSDGTNFYRMSDPLFYFFNRDTAFFASNGCYKTDTSFQYFRYPNVISDQEYLYHAPKVMNCISKSNEISTLLNVQIDTIRNNYLSINHSDQYQISKLKKYRFSSDYNREIKVSENFIYLLKEIPSKIYYEDKVRKYEHFLEISKFNKQLKLIETLNIKDKFYSFSFIKNKKLYLFDIYKNKCLIYEI